MTRTEESHMTLYVGSSAVLGRAPASAYQPKDTCADSGWRVGCALSLMHMLKMPSGSDHQLSSIVITLADLIMPKLKLECSNSNSCFILKNLEL